mgnify:CR=1 FL=1
MNFIHIIYGIVIGIYEGIWRRAHGGGLGIHDWYDKYIKPWLKLHARIIDWICNYPLLFCIAFFYKGMVWWHAAIATLIMWAFWDITFGMYMGIGMHPYPDKEDKDEYDRQYPICWLLNLIFPDNHNPTWGRYGIAYDFCGMWLRFTYPLIPLLFLGFSPWILTLGLIVAINYYLDVWVLKWWDAEIMSGFFTGLFFVLL